MNTAPTTKTVTMNVDDFVDVFKPLKNLIQTDASWNGCMFETHGLALEYVTECAETNPNQVWTILETDGQTTITNGMHRVNRVGFLFTEKAAAPDTFYDITDPDDVQSDDDSEEDE